MHYDWKVSDANALDATVTFSQTGTYMLRLTGDDGLEQTTSDVTITVNPALPSVYATWAGGDFTHAFGDADPTNNGDGDRKSNMMEFAFGTDPTLNDDGSLTTDGLTNGDPVAMEAGGGGMEFYFLRRKDHGDSGSVSYTVQFSADLSSFTNSTADPTPVRDSQVNANYEIVKVPYPEGSRFGRVMVNFVD